MFRFPKGTSTVSADMLPGTKKLSNLPGQFQMGINHLIFRSLHSTVLGQISQQLTSQSESNQQRSRNGCLQCRSCRTAGIKKCPWHSPQWPHRTSTSLRLSWEVFRGHTGAVKLHNSFGNSHCTEDNKHFWLWCALATPEFGGGLQAINCTVKSSLGI